MKYFMILIALSAAIASASELKIAPYVQMQEALAKDDMKAALASHKLICDKELGELKKSYKDCGKKFKDIDDLRTSFKTLSNLYLEHGDKKEMNGYIKASCPMAGAKWIQKDGKLANPYYGKSMLECGEKI